jgi:type I restriction-modification system DNA methylase subunit
VSALGSFIWPIADQIGSRYRLNQYSNAILPPTILSRLACILQPERSRRAATGAVSMQPANHVCLASQGWP